MFGLYTNKMASITEFKQIKFNEEMIDNCFFVKNINTPEAKLVPLSSIFDYIKESAEKNGVIVELIDNKLFIHKLWKE